MFIKYTKIIIIIKNIKFEIRKEKSMDKHFFNEQIKMTKKNIVFSAAVMGFHVYKRNWKPDERELKSHKDNPYDIFSMKVYKTGTGQSVSHSPMEKKQDNQIHYVQRDKCYLENH